MSNDVSVTIDVANQSIISSDTSIIGVPTQNFEIVTFDNKPCIRSTHSNHPYYTTFTISPNIKSFSCDVFLQSVNGFTLLIEFDSISNTKYSLVYYPYGEWTNPDNAVFDRNNVLVGVWVTVTYSSVNRTITLDNGTNQLVRTIDSAIVDLNLANFNNYNVYLTNISAETSTRYINKPGLAEIWANIKNYVSAQLLGKSNTGHTHTKSQITDFPTLATVATSGSYNDLSNKPTIPTVNNATLTIQKNGTDVKTFTANSSTNVTANITVPTKTSELTNDSGFLTSHQDLSDYIPRRGGFVITSNILGRTINNDSIALTGGNAWGNGATIILTGKDYYLSSSAKSVIRMQCILDSTVGKNMWLYPSGTWTWDGTACQITSDQRYKQQITEIDDKLLDAWSDVGLVQFKYNDAVEEKGTKARLHTGFVVQQIDSACKKHGVDISAYGLYCHEVYPEETEEVEIEQADGTKTKEKKVIREASEHYSLRYTEALIVECKYLRRCVKQLTARIEELEKGNNTK